MRKLRLSDADPSVETLYHQSTQQPPDGLGYILHCKNWFIHLSLTQLFNKNVTKPCYILDIKGT